MGIKKFLAAAAIVLFMSTQAIAGPDYKNHLRTDFLNNSAVIYAVNIRTFNAKDTNGNGIIDFDEGEISGNFMNAINRLVELKNLGVTAIHMLPITPVGKTKALGTAGSLYSAASFNTLNPQLKDNTSMLPIEEQARQFINSAHANNIAVIADVPGCGSYDLYMQRPELFVKDSSGQPVIPADWTDVRLLDAGDETKINNDLLNVYKEYVDLMMRIGVDGIRADVAHSKPAKFWKELIDYSRQKDPQFLWLAESSDSWKDAVSPKAVFTPYDQLLKAGFDGYYGSYFNLKNWKTGKELEDHVNFNLKLGKTIGEKKSVIGSFSTHDEVSPLLVKGFNYQKMIMWLNATLPLNSYSVDGFDSGDTYIYFWANRKAPVTYTDDDYYFVHRGKIDIFNFSRKPGGKILMLKDDFRSANQLKVMSNNMMKNGVFKFLKTSSPSTFAYTISNDEASIIVIGNLNFSQGVTINTTVPRVKPDDIYHPMNFDTPPTIEKGKIVSELEPGEIQVLIFENFSLK
ncbi:hypothetical protein IKP85_07045 [bacterium]|nr:hypothetical protein [bacterium]